MSKPMRINDIAVGCGYYQLKKFNGMQCQIIGELAPRQGRNMVSGRMDEGMMYEVRWANGEEALVSPIHVRFLYRKPGPHDAWATAKVQKFISSLSGSSHAR